MGDAVTAARAHQVGGALLAVGCVSWPLGNVLEAGMATHMLVQFPLLLLAGALLQPASSAGSGTGVRFGRGADWNRLGIAGLAFAACVLALTMIPRLLDLALVDVRVEAVKIVALLAAGAALRASWQRAGLVVQGFFLGNVLPMTAVVGTLYQDAPERLCNGYRLDEQVLVGTLLVALAVAGALGWLVAAGIRMHRAENMNAPASGIALPSENAPAPRLAAFVAGGSLHEERSWPEDASTTTSRRP
ncbi:MAG: hypothetical protein LT102_00745 [Burkholderiaceae bacterium]|nr:hypothetical protein [Burkholderiaceae bacterium]